jgi:hypothetical protein
MYITLTSLAGSQLAALRNDGRLFALWRAPGTVTLGQMSLSLA